MRRFHWLIFFFQTPGWAFSCFARKRPVSLWPGTETKMAAVLRFGRASTCLRQQNCKEILCAFMLCFFCVLNPLFLRVCLHLRQVYFCCSRLLCFRAVDSAGFSLCFPPPFPPIYLLFMHCICNALMFCFCFVLFSARCIFLRQIVCCCFCRLCFLCFVAPLIQLVPCASAPFCSARFARWPIICNIWVLCFWLRFVWLCLRFFLLVYCPTCWLCVFLLFATLGKYRRPGPCGHSNAFFASSPMLYWPTTPILTIHVHLYTSDLVCVPVASVYLCFWQYAHIVRSCTYVFPDTHSASMCALGVLCVSRDPWPKLEPRYRLFCMICKLK